MRRRLLACENGRNPKLVLQEREGERERGVALVVSSFAVCWWCLGWQVLGGQGGGCCWLEFVQERPQSDATEGPIKLVE